jgi:hypothetical protein
VPFGGSPLLQKGELDFSPAKENPAVDGLAALALRWRKASRLRIVLVIFLATQLNAEHHMSLYVAEPPIPRRIHLSGFPLNGRVAVV